MKTLKITIIIFAFILLTAITQAGGLILLLSLTTHSFINKKIRKRNLRIVLKFLSFIALYILLTFILIPLLAKPFGRIPLAITGDVQPLNFLTCLLNRHYVRADLARSIQEAAMEMKNKFPGTTINYLDANFPFLNKFPLLPHLSHDDGKKLDLSFYYKDSKTNNRINKSPSFIGYGICEEPKPGEDNKASFCSEKGYWQYSFLKSIIPQGSKKYFLFDDERTRELINILVHNDAIGKIFLEPHLKTRLKLTSEKIRFHGCQAVRHDDHIHIQLK